jgi:signal transduction histidine kinase
MKITRSLLLRLIIGQLFVVIFFSLLAVGNIYWQIYKTGEGDYDKQIGVCAKTILLALESSKQNINVLKQNIAFADSQIQIGVKLALNGDADNQNPNPVLSALRVVDQSGVELYRSAGFSRIPFESMPIGFSKFNLDDRNWRAATYSNADGSLTLQVAQSSTLAADGIFDAVGIYILKPLLIFLPFVALVSWFSASRGLAPLREFTQMIARRGPNDMKPLSAVSTYAEITPLANEINLLLKKLKTTISRERDFLADAAHELRTPLAVIQAQAHVLERAANVDDKNLAANELHIGIERAASLIQKLLLTARVSVEDFAPRFETTDLTAFVQERIARFSVLAANKTIDMELAAPTHCFVNIDRETFSSAIDNVIDNAIRYTPSSGAIRVEIATLDNSQVRLRVADNGHGISPEFHERVFERFFRVAGTEQQGSGLGLAIVRRVLSLHGGDVTLSSGLDRRGLSVDLIVPARA